MDVEPVDLDWHWPMVVAGMPWGAVMDVLRQAKGLIADPGRWVAQGAMTADGRSVLPIDPACVRWSLYSAVDKVAWEDRTAKDGALRALTSACARRWGWWNLGIIDGHIGHAGVLLAFDEAIKLAEDATNGR